MSSYLKLHILNQRYLSTFLIPEECPAGTRARKKILKHRKHSNITLHRITLKPHCRSCPLGTYQPSFGQTSCIKCPQGYNTTNAGSTDINDCVAVAKSPCTDRINVCNNGQCVSNNSLYYSCDCFDNYVGRFTTKCKLVWMSLWFSFLRNSLRNQAERM